MSESETQHLGACLAPWLRVGDVIALSGELGSGKTCFVKGLALGLGIPSTTRITSPTFTLINEYVGGRLPLIHADLYRLEQENELREVGLWERMEFAVGVVEWADKFAFCDQSGLSVSLKVDNENARSLTIRAQDPKRAELVEAWKSSVNEARLI